MAGFKIAYMRAGSQPAYEQRPIGAGTFSVGTLLTFNTTSGNLEVCAASANPQYVLAQSGTTTTGQLVAVQPISSDAVYETTCTASMSSVKLGSTVTTSSGTAVTATAVTAVNTGAYGATVVLYPIGTDTEDFYVGAPVHVVFTGKPAIAAG